MLLFISQNVVPGTETTKGNPAKLLMVVALLAFSLFFVVLSSGGDPFNRMSCDELEQELGYVYDEISIAGPSSNPDRINDAEDRANEIEKQICARCSQVVKDWGIDCSKFD